MWFTKVFASFIFYISRFGGSFQYLRTNCAEIYLEENKDKNSLFLPLKKLT